MRKLRLFGSIITLLFLLASIGYGTDGAKQPPAEVAKELGPNYELLHQGKSAGLGFGSPELSAGFHDYDVVKYTLEVKLAPADLMNKLQGQATIEAKSAVSGLSILSLDLLGLVVDSCKVNSKLTSFTRVNGKLNVSLDKVYNLGEFFSVSVSYHGTPTAGLYFGKNKYGAAVTYTFTEPDRSRYWFPCYDSPSDKALSEVICTAPAGNMVVSNGVLLDVTKNPDNRVTYHWQENHPIATYLISLAISNYSQIQDLAQLGDKEVPLSYWVYPQDSAKAGFDFRNIPDMMVHFSELFGDYPFGDEKFSIAQAALTGAMEHQTCVSWGLNIEGNGSNEWIVAHELAHHWWGNLVTCQDFANIWLNEGFATYCEALWKEYSYGSDRFKGHMIGLEWHVINDSAGSVANPVFNPPLEYLFGKAVYRKGAWVLHMLRYLLGDETFFAGLKAYAESYPYSTANTEQFKAVMENQSGQDLDWFFDQWVYKPNFPKYKWSWVYTSFEGKYYLDINITQEQASPLFYKMPIQFRITGSTTDSTVSLSNSSRYQSYSLVFFSEPDSVTMDPDNWLLGLQSRGSFPAIPGDLNKDRLVTLGDVIFLVNMIFNKGPRPSPVALADVDGSCHITLSDVIYLSNYVSGKGPAPRLGCP